MQQPDFWNNSEYSKIDTEKIKSLKSSVNSFEKLKTWLVDLIELYEMSIEEKDIDSLKECNIDFLKFLKKYNKLEIESKFKGHYDSENCILSLHSGAGGTESCDWVSMLLRMYKKYLEKNDLSIEILNHINGDEIGFKSVTIEIRGENAYGKLKSEKGVHRLVRISPFDTAGKRHTTFAACEVLPLVEGDEEIEINNGDLKIDTYKASGAGGQHINKTESAIRITHIPSKIVVQCQSQRSQIKNKAQAMKMLKAKLFSAKKIEEKQEMDKMRGEISNNSFGSQIRSYVMHPYSMVKDHRTNLETGKIKSVLDGEIDEFVLEYLKEHKD